MTELDGITLPVPRILDPQVLKTQRERGVRSFVFRWEGCVLLSLAMHSTLNFLVLLHLTQLCLSAPGWFDGLDLFASNTLPQPGAPDDDLLSYASLDDNSNVNLEPLDGLNLGESSADLDMFQSSDESISGQETVAGEQDQCSFNNLQPASRVRARGTSCDDVKQSPALNLPTLNNLPKPASMNPPDWMPLEDSKLLNIPEIEDRESCPMSPRGWYYIPICGNQLGEHGWYKPTAVNPLRGWTVTEASICESMAYKFKSG